MYSLKVKRTTKSCKIYVQDLVHQFEMFHVKHSHSNNTNHKTKSQRKRGKNYGKKTYGNTFI